MHNIINNINDRCLQTSLNINTNNFNQFYEYIMVR